jgi:uncharacterized protein YjbI with pentapeptide repeats
MANREHLDVLRQGAKEWNDYRRKGWFEFPNYPDFRNSDLQRLVLNGADLSNALLTGCNLTDADLSGANLRGANLDGANLSSVNFIAADLRKAHLNDVRLTLANMHSACLSSALLINADMWGGKLSQAKMDKADLARASVWESDLQGAQMTRVNLFRASFVKSNLRDVDLSGSDMRLASFSEVDFTGAIIADCYVYGTSAWNLDLDHTMQKNLIITDSMHGGGIKVDNLEVAQFIHMLTNNKKIRDLIDTITSKAVLILGRFTPERKAILDALRTKLRELNYVSIVFDFDQPSSRNITEVVSTLAHMSRFVIADITDAKSIPQELQRIVPDNPSLPILPLIESSRYSYSMFKDFLDYPWVLRPVTYNTLDDLLNKLNDEVIVPAVNKAKEIENRRKAIDNEISAERKASH